jgi:hypothetical protein
VGFALSLAVERISMQVVSHLGLFLTGSHESCLALVGNKPVVLAFIVALRNLFV